MKCLLTALAALLCCCCCRASNSQPLDPDGKNVCLNTRDASRLVCCTGWRQEGRECNIPVCEGEQACLKDEICVYPGVCRCPPGFFGAHCKTRCPPDLWGPDCRQVCRCHPHGRCHPVTGECTCNSNRWGPQCQSACKCGRHGHCHPVHGNCTCDEGWWTSTCAKPCQCAAAGSAGAGCEQLTGRCQCRRGHWGHKCPVTCNCYVSACNQKTGACECEAGWWGPTCDRPCNCDLRHSSCGPAGGQCLCDPGYRGPYCNQACGAGTYGSGCQLSCGHCKDHSCSSTDGSCSACEPGWNGTRCDRPCPPGYHGDGCQEACPRCRTNEPCDPITGKCHRCDPGWKGPRCEELCPDRMYGDACSFLCGPCYHGNCHHVTGRCVCQPGFQGESCNSSCSALQFGLNCSSACGCGEGVGCHPLTGACPSNGRGAVLAGVLVPLMLLLFAVFCCCLCCGGGPVDSKDRAAVAEGGWSVRLKYHVYSVVANISAALPCISSWSSGLPRVTVSHHDPELTFNHSFIEPPSSGWVTEGSSFDSDEEEGEALYCVPPREDIPAVAGGEFQEMSSKCNMFLDPSGFSSEDITSPFNIPRTSSIAKSKRPSVSFAEGTRFSPKERRGSAQDPAQPALLRNKPKSTWGVLVLSALQGQGGAARPGEAESTEGEEEVATEESTSEAPEQEVTSQGPGSAGRRRTPSNQVPTCGSEPQGSHKVTTVYVTVGKGGGAVSEPPSEGPVQAMLRRLGSLQRREQESAKSKSKGAEGIAKPPRRKLGARASAWEQGGAAPAAEVSVCKPVRRKHQNSCDAAGESESGAPKRPLSSILKSVPELPGSDPRSEGEDASAAAEVMESNYLTVGAACEEASLTEVIANEAAVVDVNDEPCYENVMIQHS